MFSLWRKRGLLTAGVVTVLLTTAFGARSALSRVPSVDELLQFKGPASVKLVPPNIEVPAPEVKPAPKERPPVAAKTPRPDRKPLQTDIEIDAGPLSDEEVALYQEIFDLQTLGKMGAASEKARDIKNGLLMGHVLAQRYLHPTAYTSKYKELKNWLDDYADHPQAEDIYELALIKNPSARKNLQKPKRNINDQLRARLGEHDYAETYKSPKRRTKAQQASVVHLFRTVRKKIARERPTQALEIFQTSKSANYIDNAERDQLMALIASGYLYAGFVDEAWEYAKPAYERSGKKAPMAGWILGLISWQQEDYEPAAAYFESTAGSRYSSGWMVSAAAYWASRAHMRDGNPGEVSKWLRTAAVYPRTFYGLLATRALGQDFDFNWRTPRITGDEIEAIETSDAGLRARALQDTGHTHWAEEELLHAYKKHEELLLAYALANNLPSLSIRLSSLVSDRRGNYYDAAFYPMMPWEPEEGYRIDKALIHAFIRQESRFNPTAANPSGATGLMQLMPATATYMARTKYRGKGGRYQLKDPKINLEIGQRYIEYLMESKVVDYDLLSLAIAYNAGPGNLSKWKRRPGFTKDPLFFIETIPYGETRVFVERVLANYWIYQMRLRENTPSLDDVAQGRWANYAPPRSRRAEAPSSKEPYQTALNQ